MTCQECELALASEDRSDFPANVIDGHLAGCAACRELALELRANSEAMLTFAAEPMPTVPRITPRRQQVGWWVAVAAMLVVGFVSSFQISGLLRSKAISPHVPPGREIPTQIASSAAATASARDAWQAEAPGPHKKSGTSIQRAARRSQQNNEPRILQIKMLTDDPDVVIYWQVEN